MQAKMRTIAVIFLSFPFLITFSQDLRDLDSIARFFNDNEIEKLIQLDDKFTNFVLQGDSDTIVGYNKFLHDLILDLEKYGYYSNNVKSLVDFSDLKLEAELKGTSLYDKIFYDGDQQIGAGGNLVKSTFCAINFDGVWIEFIQYNQSIDKLDIWTDYVDFLESTGTFPNFLETLPFYIDLLDFNNQIHRLVVLIHFINHTSKDYF
jgi:hypothetical protein